MTNIDKAGGRKMKKKDYLRYISDGTGSHIFYRMWEGTG